MYRDFLADELGSVNTDMDKPDAILSQSSSMPVSGRDFLNEPVKETKLTSAALAIPRVGEDIIKSAYHGIKGIPGYYESAKTEIPGLFNTLQSHPQHALQQGLAGVAELGQNVFNLPHDIANYATNRLNLIPEDINKKIQMGRMPESQQEINSLLGTPKYPGETLARGLGRNALNITGAGALGKTLNPARVLPKSIANEVLAEEKKQVLSHNKKYNNIWAEAEKSGYNKVPVNEQLLSNNLGIIEKYKTPREYQSLEDFILNPTLQNAQKAQSDMGIMHRKLGEKSRTGALTSEELALYNAARDAEKHIENSMFKNSKGETNKSLQKKYEKLTNSYRENVVPYKYNEHIQAYKNKEMLPQELVNALSRGEFAAKKGSKHPVIKLNKLLMPSFGAIGLGGLAGAIANQLLGNRPASE